MGDIDEIKGFNFYDNKSDPIDTGDGTHVAGIAGARSNNGIGIAGVCSGCKLMALRAGAPSGSGSVTLYASAAKALNYAADAGADVANMSFGGSASDWVLAAAIDRSYRKGMGLVAAAGNNSSNQAMFPASADGVISVAATTSDGSRASFSNFGSHVDVAAPGTLIVSTVLKGKYERWSGTSMASPMIAAVYAIAAQKHPSYSQEKIEWMLRILTMLRKNVKQFFAGFGAVDALAG